MTWRRGATRYNITVHNPDHVSRGIVAADVNGTAVDPQAIPLYTDGATHNVTVVLGRPIAPDRHDQTTVGSGVRTNDSIAQLRRH